MEDFESDSDDDMLGDVEISNTIETVAHTSDQISTLRTSTRFVNLIAQIEEALKNENDNIVGILTDSPQYKLIIACNEMIQEIDEDISRSHLFVSNIYGKKFPELDQLVPGKLDYLKVVERIGNQVDMTKVDLTDILPSATVMVVTVTGSTTSGEMLSESNMKDCIKGCNEVNELMVHRSMLLSYVEGKMSKIAPNLCVLIGSRITAQLMTLVGGLINLTRIPSCNVQVVGQDKNKSLSGFSHASAQLHTGILYGCDLVQACPPYLRKKALKVVSAKVALVARFDSYKSDVKDATEGHKIRQQIESKFAKWLEPTKGKTKKALPIPEEKKRNKRGGKRVKRFKERFAQSELSKQQNKLSMSITDGEYGDSAMGLDHVSSHGVVNGNLRGIVRKKPAELLSAKKKQKLAFSNNTNNSIGGSISSLAFTPVQGIELVTANTMAEKVKSANQKWFNNTSGFLSAVPK